MTATILIAALALKAVIDQPPAITGNCHPARVHFTGHIESDRAGLVKYSWARSDKPSTATFTVNFTAPGKLPVTYDWMLKGPADGWVVLHLISPESVHSPKARFEVKCGR